MTQVYLGYKELTGRSTEDGRRFPQAFVTSHSFLNVSFPLNLASITVLVFLIFTPVLSWINSKKPSQIESVKFQAGKFRQNLLKKIIPRLISGVYKPSHVIGTIFSNVVLDKNLLCYLGKQTSYWSKKSFFSVCQLKK